MSSGVPESIGCGSYQVAVMPRGLAVNLGFIDFVGVSWGRKLSDLSEAKVVVPVQDARCRNMLIGVHTWEHEVVIYREPNDGVVWTGPVTNMAWSPNGGQVTVTASDVSGWYRMRRLLQDHLWPDPGIDQAEAFAAYHHDAIDQDNSMGMILAPSPTGIPIVLSTLGGQHLLASDQIGNITQNGLDYYAIHRTVYVGSEVIETVPFVELLDSHVASAPDYTEDGWAKANNPGVRGAGGGDAADPVWGEARDPALIARDGLLSSVTSDEAMLTNVAASAAAQGELELVGDAPVAITALTLDPSCPVSMADLRPGRLINVRIEDNPIPLIMTMRIQNLNVASNADGADQISLDLQPVGA